MELSGSAWMTKLDRERININIGVKLDSGVSSVSDLGKYRAYSEVYSAARNTLTPLAWIESLVNVNNDHFVTLQFNLRWAALASVNKGPLVLKNTYIVDASTNFPVTRFDNEIVVRNSHFEFVNDFKEVLSLKAPFTISDEMKFGVNPFKNLRINSTAGPNLILLHGYCSADNPFQKNSNIFSGAAYFLSANSNDLNDAFALKVHNYAQSVGSVAYSTIGHSQGGIVSLHLLNYYWTGLDLSGSGRRIQTVGTPWNGNSASGSAASLGKAFGVGCGANSDMSVDGANNWLSGIHEDHPQEVYFYTTTYQQGNFFGDYCNMAINALLQWPNDGVSELKYSKLTGGNNCGNKDKWCHTTGMKYDAQYHDNVRNAEMNSKAAR